MSTWSATANYNVEEKEEEGRLARLAGQSGMELLLVAVEGASTTPQPMTNKLLSSVGSQSTAPLSAVVKTAGEGRGRRRST
jgi:hypothetical protein